MNLALPLAILYILELFWGNERHENKHQPKTCGVSVNFSTSKNSSIDASILRISQRTMEKNKFYQL
mgnify:CR=1 FL=1